MKRSTFIQNLVGFYGVASIPSEIVIDYSKIYLLQCFLRGFQFYEGPKIIKQINKTGLLELIREPQNQYDSQAIALHFEGIKIGYIPAEENTILSVLMDSKLLKIQAEITHIEPNAQTWENIHIALYALKEIINDNQLNTEYQNLETPYYHTIKNSNDTYSRVYYTEKQEEKSVQENYFDKLILFSEETKTIIEETFENEEEFNKAFKSSKIIINKKDVRHRTDIDDLLQTIDDLSIELENKFGEEKYIVANVDALSKYPEIINSFVKKYDKTGEVFYELIVKDLELKKPILSVLDKVSTIPNNIAKTVKKYDKSGIEFYKEIINKFRA